MMESFWVSGLVALWGVVLVNLLLTLRVLRFMRAMEDKRILEEDMENIPEIPLGKPAPDFKAKTIAGKTVRLEDFAGRPVAFAFVSPACGSCRKEVPNLVKLGAVAARHSGLEVVLVSDHPTAATHEWIRSIGEEDKVRVDLRTLVAPRTSTNFLATYNPRGVTPSFCYVDANGVVRARGPIGIGEWPRLKQQWEGSSVENRPRRSAARFK